jgi:hypothetical protein
MSAETLTPERFASALKVLHAKKMTTYGLEDQPMWAWFPKKGGFNGRHQESPIRFAPGGNGSHNFNQAQASKGSSKYTHFTNTRKKSYKMVSIDNEALEASEGDGGAYLKATSSETEANFIRLMQQTAADAQGNGGGSIATVLTVDSGANTFTVSENEIGRFEIDDRLQFGSTDGTSGAVIPTAFGYAKVTGVDHDTLTITLSASFDTIASVAVDATTNKYVFPAGNFGIAMTGLAAWIPRSHAGLGTSFKGVTRSDFPTRLAGISFDGSAYGLAECLERAAARGKREHCHPDVFWVNYNRFQDLSLELGAKAERDPAKIGEFAYDRLRMYTGGRQISVMADAQLADDQCYALKRDTWYFWHLNGCPRFLGKSSKSNLILEPAADGWEIRTGWYGDLICESPGENMTIELPV